MKIRTLIIAGLFAATMASQGAVTISGLPQSGGDFRWPSSALLGGYEQYVAHAALGVGIKLDRNFGQTFTIVQNGTIEQIAFSFKNFQDAGSDFTVEFYKVASVSTGGTPTGPVDSGTFSAADISALGFSNGDDGTLVLDVTSTAVTAGDVYAWEITAGATSIFEVQNIDNGLADGQSFGGVAGARDYFVAAYGAVYVPVPTDMQVQTTTDLAGTAAQAGWALVDGDRAATSISGVVSNVTITVTGYGRSGGGDGGNYRVVDHTDGDLDNLLSGGRIDGAATNLTLAGLADGNYSITTYHHTSYDHLTNGESNTFDFDVTLTDANGTALVHDNLRTSLGATVTTADLGMAVTAFTVSGGNDVTLTFSPDADYGDSDQLVLNGFEITVIVRGTVISIQ